MGSKSTNLPAIAGKVPDGTKEESRIKKFSRWIKNERIHAETCFLPWADALLESLADHRTLLLAMDGSEVGQKCLALMVSAIYKKRALPIMIQLLFILTTLINLLSMAGALWLGFYIVTRSSRSPLSWLAALALWSLATFFLHNTLVIHLAGNDLLHRLRLVGLLGLPLWFHLTVLLPLERTDRLAQMLSHPVIRLGTLGLAYGLTSFTILHGFLFPGPTFDPPLPPIYVAGRTPRASNPYVIASVTLVGSLTLLILWRGWTRARRVSLRRLFASLLIVTVAAFLAGFYLTLGPWIRARLPVLPADAILGAAVMLFGYNVARYNAFIEGRTVERDALYSLIGIGLVTTFYGLVALFLNLGGQASVLTVVVILICAILSHSLYDGARTALDRLFYRGQFRQLRSNLRLLAREAGTSQELPDQLHVTLSTLCGVLHIQKGFIALRRGDRFLVTATKDAAPVSQTFSLAALEATDILALPRPGVAGPQDMALLIPLSMGGAQIGALVLGAKASHQPYSEEDLDLLDDLADQMATVIHVWRLQEENAEIINEMVAAFHERERALQRQLQQIAADREREAWPVLEGMGEEDFVPLLEECLRQLHDFSYLGEHVLARLRIVNEQLDVRPDTLVTHIDRGKALNQVLLQALDKLRPVGAEPRGQDVPSREWHQYIVLHDAYVRNRLTRDIMGRLYISEPTFHRTRRRAIRGVAKALREMEQAAVK